MPLLDHFYPPLSERRQWHAFHSVWASMIALDLNMHQARSRCDLHAHAPGAADAHRRHRSSHRPCSVGDRAQFGYIEQ
ncbi:MAG: hypothetical protein B7Z73_17045 [Planctomycetia bacterium 21-64-5]|nr:MAG: hypothetical protein B7Z73_17045 [Planctomycetia bacterium 21-64-5]